LDSFWIERCAGLGVNSAASLNLPAGPSVFSYTGFPSQYSAYRFVQQLGLSEVHAVRMLDSQSGRWVVASVLNGQVLGDDFPIPGARS